MDKHHPLGSRPHRKHTLKKLGLALLLALPLPLAAAPWQQPLQERLTAIDAAYPGELGVFVKDLDSGATLSFRGDEYWYLASGIKVPVAIEVMRRVERGEFSLDTQVRLKASDYVDGAGQTNWQPAGAMLSVRFLLDQMLVYSDNTATDVLIRLVGLDSVNTAARELAPEGLGPITTLADVRRHAYSAFHDNAFQLTGQDMLALRRMADERKRIELLANILEVSLEDFAATDLDSAFDAYYATDLNAGRLSAFGELLGALALGQALQPESTEYLMSVLSRIKTGDRRIKAGLPSDASFAHKTGTQRARTCDMGVVSTGREAGSRQVVIAACTRGSLARASSEAALRAVGDAIQASGVLEPAPSPRRVL